MAESRKLSNIVSYRRRNERPAAPSSVEEYKARARKRKKKSVMRVMISLFAVAVVVGAVFLWRIYRSFNGYEVVDSADTDDFVGAQYQSVGEHILRYSSNGAALIGSDLTVLWEKSYDMATPYVDSNGDYAIVYEKSGAMIDIFKDDEKNGYVGTITTDYPVLKAKVTPNGLVGAVLQGSTSAFLAYYTREGELIFSGKPNMSVDGYPVDISISPQGNVMMTSYVRIDTGIGQEVAYIAFYNFEEIGQQYDGNLVSGSRFEGAVAPQVEFLTANRSIAFCDNALVLFKGADAPKLYKTVGIEGELISTFYNDELVGYVQENNSEKSEADSGKAYKLFVYDFEGKQKFTQTFNVKYSKIKLSNDHVVLFNDYQLCVFSDKGVEKYNGNIDEGSINDIICISPRKYLVVLDDGLKVIKLK